MHHIPSRILPRLVLDTISSLWLAHDCVDDDLKVKQGTRSQCSTMRT